MFHSIIYRSSTIVFDDIKIRLIETQDAEQITAYYQRNRRFLAPWEPFRHEAFFSLAGWKQRLEQIMTLHRHEMAFYFVIEHRETSDIIGVINFSNLVKSPFYACHVGYSLDLCHQGQAIMHRALTAAIEWIFTAKHFHRIIAVYMPHNKKSGNVLAAIGFEQEGLAKDYLLINGQWQDHILTSLVNANWSVPLS